MISLTVTGHAEPEQSREEIARLLKEYGAGAVCLLRDCSDDPPHGWRLFGGMK